MWLLASCSSKPSFVLSSGQAITPDLAHSALSLLHKRTHAAERRAEHKAGIAHLHC